MRVCTPKQREWSSDLLERAIELHGHGGPYMVIGLRMGLLALKHLDAGGWFDLRCLASLRWGPPDSCVIDGIQSSTGCTMGKHNIEIEEKEGISVSFIKNDEALRITLKKEIEEKIRNTLTKEHEEIHELISELINACDQDIFDIC